ncbi:MAG: DinB family protein [Paenibacillaceae bacterium]|uniref:DinB family protein n=1 Tax=Paenibacillus mellifer TaxID=2937794 RepID=A0A9X1XXA2_9BACL|nr:DinB family protein [Paenibacillus mellifer]MBW4840580.1 DinB family protein [Paenibacillaceae bacterium]MCK8487705.1 DinB family protein [Paenibacillus mellifer]
MTTQAAKNELLNQFREWTSYVRDLESLDWTKPLNEGKWSVHGLVSHLMMWDKYFWERAIQPISQDQPLSLQELDFDEFNREAVEFGHSKSKSELIELAVYYRRLILEAIEGMDEAKLNQTYGEFTIESYLRDFIWHDQHHRSQIEERKAYLV